MEKGTLLSREYTGNTTLPANTYRKYFYIIFTQGSGTVEFGGGGGKVPFTNHQYYEPYVTPLSEIKVESTGTYVIVEG